MELLNKKVKKREEWLDALRALAMCLVVFGHQYHGNTAFFVFTSPIKMPLFFILSGYLFSPKGYNTIDFFLNLFFRLVIPWLFFGLIFSLLLIPIQGISQFIERLQNILSGNNLWFMPAFIIGQVIFYFINKYIKNETVVVFSCLLIGIGGLYCSYMHIMRYAVVDVALSSQLFFIMGSLLNKHEYILKLSNKWTILLTGLYIALCVSSLIIWPRGSFDVHKGYYYNYGISFLLIIIGCTAIMNIARRIKHFPLSITMVGQNTLLIYILHSYTSNATVRLFALLNIPSKGHLFFAFTATLISVIACTYFSIIISRYIPLLNGTKKVPNGAFFRSK